VLTSTLTSIIFPSLGGWAPRSSFFPVASRCCAPGKNRRAAFWVLGLSVDDKVVFHYCFAAVLHGHATVRARYCVPRYLYLSYRYHRAYGDGGRLFYVLTFPGGFGSSARSGTMDSNSS
jgi:hypothetical protein